MNNLSALPMDLERARMYEKELITAMEKIGVETFYLPKVEDIVKFQEFPYQNMVGNLFGITQKIKMGLDQEDKKALACFEEYHKWLQKFIDPEVSYDAYSMYYSEKVFLTTNYKIFEPLNLDGEKTEEQILMCEKIVEDSDLIDELKEMKLKNMFEKQVNYNEILELLTREAIAKKVSLLMPLGKIINKKMNDIILPFNEKCEMLKLEIRTRKNIK